MDSFSSVFQKKVFSMKKSAHDIVYKKINLISGLLFRGYKYRQRPKFFCERSRRFINILKFTHVSLSIFL